MDKALVDKVMTPEYSKVYEKARAEYNLHNLSRHSYILECSTQEFQMSDEFLFEGGLMDFFKDIDRKYRLGQL